VIEWTPDEPGAGDLDALALRVRQLTDHVEHAASVEIATRQAVSAAAGFWSGSASTSWSVAAVTSASAWSALREWGDAERIAVRRYVAVVESIAARANRLSAQKAAAEREIAVLDRVDDVLDPRLVAARRQDQADLRDVAGAALSALATERQEADDACIAAVRAARQRSAGHGPRHAPSVADLVSLGDLGLLADLSALGPRRLATLLASDPALADRVHGIDPDVVARWWTALDDTSRTPLVEGLPDVVGSLEGVAYRDRDRANHLVLDREFARLSALPSLAGHDADALAALTQVRSALGAGMAATPPRELVSLSLDGNPKAAISVGDLDTAAYVSYLVPGMGTRVAGDMTRYTRAASGLGTAERRVANRDRAAFAVVAWLDYDAPGPTDVNGVSGDRLAEAGGRRLAASVGGLQAVRDHSGASLELTLGGHSYGTDVVAFALTRSRADHAVLLGSAGIATRLPTARSLGVPDGQVFATQGSHDGWAPVGQIISGRLDPTADRFGAHVFSSESTVDEAGRPLEAVAQHGPLAHTDDGDRYSYLDDGTSAQYGFAQAAVGRGAALPRGGTPVERMSGGRFVGLGSTSTGGRL
jgi:hypothetical protein